MPETVMLPADFAGAPISIWRRSLNFLVTLAAAGAVILVLLPLGAVFGYLIYKGIGSINWAFLTQIPKPPGEPGGGMANAIGGSVYILLIASTFGVPLGIGAGIYLSVTQGHFSALAGGVALAIMMVPTITRTTEEMLLLVPQAVREAAYGLGVSRWRTTLSITLRTATSGVITGVMLAFARVAGETAPLLFTAFGNQYWNWKMNQPTAALSLQIFTYAISPFDEWHRQAWAGALILIVLIVASVGAVRLVANRGMLKGAN